ncbi:MAG: hypothetical protein P4M04_07230 [Acidobacteriota bacterium]|nr:hypothetical protein [Acidobacteriota bacterium]
MRSRRPMTYPACDRTDQELVYQAVHALFELALLTAMVLVLAGSLILLQRQAQKVSESG